MPASVVGRDAELSALSDFLVGIPDGARALVLEGEAGMGKTTLFDACLAEAREVDVRVLVARPAKSESELSFAGLGDLLGANLDVLESLPSAQQRALSRALVLEDDPDAPADPRAVGVALQSALRMLAESRPTLVAVDDVQWLDTASGGALSFACRRFGEECVGVLLALRSGLPSNVVDDLERSLVDRVETIEVGPLDVAALHRLVQDRLDTVLPRPLLAEVCQASGGNPFYALEIVRTLQRRGASVEAGQPLPVPDSLHDLLDERLGALPTDCRDFLLAAAAHAHPTIAITEAATQVDAEAGLLPALEAGIVELDGPRIRFTHPLLAACAYEAADRKRRSAIHVRLSEILEDPEARAWQLAAATDQRDEAVASALEDAAHHARARGAPRPAALLLDRAHELTPTEQEQDAHRRAIDAAYLHFEAGDSSRAEARLREVIASLPPGGQRARALVRVARVRSYQAQLEASELFMQAIEEAGTDRETLSLAHEGVATCLFRMRERLDEAVDHADLAARLALELGERALAAEALGSKLLPEGLLGRESASDTVVRALELQEAAEDRRVLAQPLWMASVYWWWSDEHERARDTNRALLQRASELGDESSAPYVLILLGLVEAAMGEYESALRDALEGQELARQSGQSMPLAYNLAVESLVHAECGRPEEARSAAERALELVPATAGRPAELVARWALGHLELSLGHPRPAADYLEPTVVFARRERFGEPGAMRFVIDFVEALVELGQLDEACELLDRHEESARRLGRVSALASCLRCRGLLASQSGDLDSAVHMFEEALGWHSQVELPLDRARTLLALGVAQRRMKRRRESRVTLDEALGLFEGIGAALWAERTRGELKRISGRAATPGGLTPAEQRVAALVAEGKTNKEVAAALFVSDRTVEGHLAHIFGKLGIRHRTELPGALHTRGIDLSNTGDSPVSAGPSAP